jgi:carboxylesterase
VYISQVLLGGHGRSYADFRKSTWQDWQRAITEEYSRLVQAGYKNISLLGSSASGALLLELLSSGYFNGKTIPGQVLLIDPIVIPSNKSLSLVPVLGPMLGYVETEQTAAEDRVFYHYRPEETLRELQSLLNEVRKDLQKGIGLPPGCAMKVYKSKKDASADPVSAVLIYKGVKTSAGHKIAVEMVDSELHVFTRLDLLNTTARDKGNQEAAFRNIVDRVSGK